ncbi:hypothetical protein [Sphingobacterium faecium]|uniref:hypothetical protein n=1 Tax=Sphingobacterium faecium TaxID=34087 RepID=UPI00247AA0DB|nr:hypothetical protein [Sphingobacterium faecium]WGQ15542.1 hypothetical protein QG727_03840 [Sphingobacterium faecium]
MVHQVEAIKRLPADGIKVLWFDSRGSIEGQEFATSDEVKDLIGWCYDTWIDVTPPDPNRMKALENCDPIEVSENVFDIAPERHEINL